MFTREIIKVQMTWSCGQRERKRSLCSALVYLRGDNVLINVRDSSINCFFFPVIKFILYFVEHFCWLAEMTINHCVINLINGVFMKCNLSLNHVTSNNNFISSLLEFE